RDLYVTGVQTCALPICALPTLTPAHQRMAQYVLENPFRAATMRIDEFATAVDVSVATANRFARALGFEGYPQFRTELVRGFEARSEEHTSELQSRRDLV